MGACVMHRFIGLIARFKRDERGAFAVMFGLMAVVLIAMGGAVVDYVTLEQTRNRAQIALDAAALALQPEIFKTPLDEDDIRIRAQALLVERIGEEWNVIVDDPIEIDVNVAEGSLYFRARVTVPTLFVTLVGVDELSAQIQSEATRKKLALEVVMVLDNSGSMQAESRMTRLVEAAKCATYILMYDEVSTLRATPTLAYPLLERNCWTMCVSASSLSPCSSMWAPQTPMRAGSTGWALHPFILTISTMTTMRTGWS